MKIGYLNDEYIYAFSEVPESSDVTEPYVMLPEDFEHDPTKKYFHRNGVLVIEDRPPEPPPAPPTPDPLLQEIEDLKQELATQQGAIDFIIMNF